MAARSTPRRIAVAATAAVLLTALLAPGPAVADEAVVNGGIVTDTNYLGPDGVVRVLPIDPATNAVRTISPEGDRIAYVEEPTSREDPFSDLWSIEAGAAPVKLAVLGEAPVDRIDWSPDGGRIAVTSAFYRPSSGAVRSFLHVVDLAAGSTTQLAETSWADGIAFGGLSWSEDGERIALGVTKSEDDARDIMWVDAADGSVTPLTDNCPWAGPGAESGWELADDCGYPQGRRLFDSLALHPDGSRLLTSDRQGMYTVDTTTGDITPLRDGKGYTQPIWSPDGERVAWTAVERRGGVIDIVVYSEAVAGGDRKTLAHNAGSTWEWQPCTKASCPSFGSPRQDVRIKLVGTDYGRRWLEAAVTVKAGRKGARGVYEIPAVMQRRAAGTWKKTYAGTAYLDEAGVYTAVVRRPDPGTCRIKVTFPGDFEYEPKKFTSDPLRC